MRQTRCGVRVAQRVIVQTSPPVVESLIVNTSAIAGCAIGAEMLCLPSVICHGLPPPPTRPHTALLCTPILARNRSSSRPLDQNARSTATDSFSPTIGRARRRRRRRRRTAARCSRCRTSRWSRSGTAPAIHRVTPMRRFPGRHSSSAAAGWIRQAFITQTSLSVARSEQRRRRAMERDLLPIVGQLDMRSPSSRRCLSGFLR